MYLSDGAGGPAGGAGGPAADEAALVWSLRRIAAVGPHRRCAIVETALARQFGGCGGEIGVALRCLWMALRAGALRPVRLGCPGCAPLTGDEALMLACVRQPDSAAWRLALLLAPEGVATAQQIVGLLAGLMAVSRQNRRWRD